MKKDCDWLNHKTSYNLTANEKPGMGKRKREVANEREGKHTLISYLEMHYDFQSGQVRSGEL